MPSLHSVPFFHYVKSNVVLNSAQHIISQASCQLNFVTFLLANISLPPPSPTESRFESRAALSLWNLGKCLTCVLTSVRQTSYTTAGEVERPCLPSPLLGKLSHTAQKMTRTTPAPSHLHPFCTLSTTPPRGVRSGLAVVWSTSQRPISGYTIVQRVALSSLLPLQNRSLLTSPSGP